MREGACWQVDTLTREIALNVRGPEGKSRARGHEGMRAGEWQCKGTNAAEPRAKVQKWEYRVWSNEYRKRHNARGAPWGNRIVGWGAYFEDMRPGGHVGQRSLLPDSGG